MHLSIDNETAVVLLVLIPNTYMIPAAPDIIHYYRDRRVCNAIINSTGPRHIKTDAVQCAVDAAVAAVPRDCQRWRQDICGGE